MEIGWRRAQMRRERWRATIASWIIAGLIAGCAARVTLPATGTLQANQGSGPSVSLQASPGAQLRVQLDGASGCDSGFVCLARLSVLPDGSEAGPGPSLETSATDPIWQSDFGSGMKLIPPPNGDLPTLAPDAYVVVWSVTAQPIATDPPAALAVLASRCSTKVVVAPLVSTATVIVRFAGASTLAPGSAQCTIRQVVEASATPVPTPAAISGVALTSTAALPTAWRRVSAANVPDLRDPGDRVELGVAPDGAFIAIPSGGERQALPVLRSIDGEAWTKVGALPASKGGSISAIASSGDVIVAVGGSSDVTRPEMWVSSDGIHWTAISAPRTNGLSDVETIAANSAGFVATERSATGVAPWISSAKGAAWVRVGSLSATPDAFIVDVTASGNGFVAVGGVGGNAAAWQSSDGLTWTAATVSDGAGVTLVSVAATGQRLVAFGQGPDPRQDPLLFGSNDDGRSWVRVASGSRPLSSWPPLAAVADGFIATDYGVWTSHDGVTWDDTAWTHSVGDALAGRVPTVAANRTRIVAAAMPNGAGSPIFWIGQSTGQ